MSDNSFPLPFAGISLAVPVPKESMVQVLDKLVNECGSSHYHNFAVCMDAVPPRIYTTKLGANCIKETLNA